MGERNLLKEITQYAVMILMLILIKGSLVEAYNIPSSSMENTLLVGDFILANKFVYGSRLPLTDYRLPAVRDPERGDVVIFLYPVDRRTRYIKRCVGLPGDTIEIHNKRLYVNGEFYDNPPYSKFTDTTRSGEQIIQPRYRGTGNGRDNFGPYVVPDGNYFMMGDNRDNSYDSRWWGPVPQELILGQALVIHWSWDDSVSESPEVTVDDPLSVPRLFVHNAVHFAEKVRWRRLFQGLF